MAMQRLTKLTPARIDTQRVFKQVNNEEMKWL